MQLDLFYRAFRDFVAAFQEDRVSALLRDAIVRADERDGISVLRTVCTIDSDWVEAIEQGLIFIEKAINEERQFIRSNGEVDPIEKIKHVSRESVEHLARHSNLIANGTKGEELIPEKLYTVERLTDYAVYENRFLYMVLCRLKDFISLRYNRIIALTNVYHGELKMNKKVTAGKTKLEYEVSLHESREDDWFLRMHNSVKDILERLERMQRSVHYYLQTPLMTEVAKADKLKPPITKTNTLRMDKNFKEVVALYEFLSSYNKDGFSIMQQEQKLDPLKEPVADELAHAMLLLSFLSYEHGLGIEDHLREEYDKEETRRREEAKKLELERLASLKKRIKEGGESPEEYILLLEKQNRALEQEVQRLTLALGEMDCLCTEIEKLRGTVTSLTDEMAARERAHAEQIAECDRNIAELHEQQTEAEARHVAALIEAERVRHEEVARVRAEANEVVRGLETNIAGKEEEARSLSEELKTLKKADDVLHARLTALRKEHGLLADTDDYTSEEAFSELERQFEALGELVRGEWRSAKRLLREEFLHTLKKSFSEKIKGTFRRKTIKNETEGPRQGEAKEESPANSEADEIKDGGTITEERDGGSGERKDL